MGIDEDQVYYLKKARRANERYKVLLANPKFQEDVLHFRIKWGIPESGIKTDEQAKKWHDRHEKQRSEFYANLRTLMRKHKVAPRQELTIYRYCLYNDSHTPISMLDIVSIQTEDKEGENFTLKLIISPDTTLEDIKRIWPFVKEEQEKLVSWKGKKVQPTRYFDRDKLAYDLQQKGKKMKEIAETLNKKYHGNFVYSDIPNLIRSHKKKIKM